MKFNIDINQYSFMELDLIDKLDIIDMAIFDTLKSFSSSPKIDTMQSMGFVWYKFRWELVPKQLPMIKIRTRQGIWKRFKKLKDAGILIAHDDNQVNNDSWFRFSAKAQELEYSDTCKQSFTGTNNDLQQRVNNDLQGTVNDCLHDNSIINHNNIKEDNISKEKELPFWLSNFYSEQSFVYLLEFSIQPTEKFIREQISKLGEDSVKRIFIEIEKYCTKNTSYSKDRKNLSQVFNKFAKTFKSALIEEAEQVISEFYAEIFDEQYQFSISCSKHLAQLIEKIRVGFATYSNIAPEQVEDDSLIQALQSFFSKLPEKYKSAEQFKLPLINHNYQSIKNEIRTQNNSKSGSKNSSTQGVGNIDSRYGI